LSRSKLLNTAGKLFALKHSFHRWHKVAASARLNHVAQCTQPESFLYYIRGGFLSEENDLGVWNELANLPARLDSIQAGQTDIQQNQIRLKLDGFLDRG
jgi:predicted nucleic acid-binding Zn ribbon protein